MIFWCLLLDETSVACGLGLFASSRHWVVNGFYHLIPLRFACKTSACRHLRRRYLPAPSPFAVFSCSNSGAGVRGSGSITVPQSLHQPAAIFASDDDSDATGPPEETPERETETWQQADATDRTREEKKPEQPETPERSSLAGETAEQAAQYVDVFKPDGCCATLPPPPAHGSEGPNDEGSSPRDAKPEPPSAGASGKRPDVAAAKSRLLAFRSFSRYKKGKNPGDAGVPSPGEHRPADGKAWEEVGAEHKEKGKARWKRLWK